ncbi:MAG: translocation/assembly module TamB domain-containing protein, partial [bacterium]|nr:translocation/assembly module TamB domain-containing protein [bacterium]
MHSKSRSLIFAVLALLVLFATGLLLFRSFLVEEKVEEVVVDNLRSIFGDSIKIESITSSDVLRQVELRQITLEEISGGSVFQGGIDRVVIGLGALGISWLKIQGAELSLSVGDKVFQKTYSDAFLGTVLSGIGEKQFKHFPLVYLEDCSFQIINDDPANDFADILITDVSGRVTSKEHYLIAYLQGRDGVESNGQVGATIAVDLREKAAAVNLDVKDASLSRYGRYLKNVPYFTWKAGRFNLEGSIGWRPQGWESTGKVILRDGNVNLDKVEELTNLSGSVLFENGKHRKRKLDGVTFSSQGITFRIIKGLEIDRAVDLHLVPGELFLHRLEEEAHNRSIPISLSSPVKTSLHITGRMPDVVVTGTAYIANVDLGLWPLKGVSISYELSDDRLSFDDVQASFLGGRIRFSGDIQLWDEHLFSLSLFAEDLTMDEIPGIQSVLLGKRITGEAELSGNLKKLDRISCRSSISLADTSEINFSGMLNLQTDTIFPGNLISFRDLPFSALVNENQAKFGTVLAKSKWNGRGCLHGSFSAPAYEGEINCGPLRYSAVDVNSIRAWVVNSEDHWSIKKLEIDLAQIGNIMFNGEFSEKQASGFITGDKLNVPFLPGLSAGAKFEAVVSGAPEAVILDGKVQFSNIIWQNINLGSLDMALSVDGPEVLLTIQDQEIVTILPDSIGYFSGETVQGTLRGTIGMDLNREERGNVRAVLECIACNLAGVKVDNAVIQCQSTDAGWHLDMVRATLGLGTVEISGYVLETGELDIKLDCKSVAASSLGTLISTEYEIEGNIDATIMITGTLADPEVSLAMEMDSMETVGLWKADKVVILAFLKDRRVQIEQAIIRFDGRVLRLSGSYPLTASDGIIDLRLLMETGSLEFISSLFPHLENVEGTGGIDLSLKGAVNNPIFNGNIELKALSMKGKGWPLPLKGGDLNVVIIDNKVDVKGALSKASPFPLTLKGELDLQELFSPKIKLEFTMQESNITLSDFIPRGMKLPVTLVGRTSAHLIFNGKPGDWTLSGDVLVSESRVGISLGSELKLLELPWPWLGVDIDIVIGDRVSFQGNLFTLDVVGNLNLEGLDGILLLNGRFDVRRGEITYLNNTFEVLNGDIRLASILEQKNNISMPAFEKFQLPSVSLMTRSSGNNFRYTGSPHILRVQNYEESKQNRRLNCEIDLQAQTRLKGVTVTMQVSGQAGEFNTRFYSSPQMPEEKILTLLTSETHRGGDEGENWTRSEPGIIKFVETGLKSSL